MPAPSNSFKMRLKAGEIQYGLWVALGSPHAAELAAGAGYDWVLIDGEHGPSDMPMISAQLQAVAALVSHPIVRLPVGETWMVKQALDAGAQTLLIPMIETADQAGAMARACRYPPDGVRGVGAALARASNYGRIGDYLTTANAEICLLLQVESVAGVDNLDAIATTDGVDGVFIGPADLAADMGFLGKPGHPEVVAAVEQAITRIVALGKPAGILTSDPALARRYLALGATFVAIGSDVGLLMNATGKLLADFKGAPAAKSAGY